MTYLIGGQDVLRSRLWQACAPGAMPEVTGWYAFLMNHIARPYLPDVLPEARIAGLNFVEQGKDPGGWRRGAARFFDSQHRVYSNHLAELCCRILEKSRGLVIARLEQIYDEIYIDEVQDLVAYDLDILKALFASNIKVTVVGDPRQSITTTSHGTNKNGSYKSLGQVTWFRDLEKQRVLRIEEQATSWRCNQIICDLADRIIATTGAVFPPTRSAQTESSQHAGIIHLSWDDAPEYIATHRAAVYRYNKTTRLPDGVVARNIGAVKGETADHVVLFMSRPMNDFLAGRSPTLAVGSAMKLYVAVTRAKHSLAFVEPTSQPRTKQPRGT